MKNLNIIMDPYFPDGHRSRTFKFSGCMLYNTFNFEFAFLLFLTQFFYFVYGFLYLFSKKSRSITICFSHYWSIAYSLN